MAFVIGSDTLVGMLDDADQAEPWLRSLGITNTTRGHRNLVEIARAGVTIELLAAICRRMAVELPTVSDPDMALNNLERFIVASRSPLGVACLIERDAEALPVLLQIFSTSQHQSDRLIRDPATYDHLRLTDGAPLSRGELLDELMSELKTNCDEKTATTLVSCFKHRHIARIAYGDIIRGRQLDVVTRQLSCVADVICEAALWLAQRHLTIRYGTPRRADGHPARFVVLGLGKLGGLELNYSSDIDLMFLYDEDGWTDCERAISNGEYFERLGRRVVRLLTETTPAGSAYRVDLRLRPGGSQGRTVTSRAGALHYYDLMGRTWERQAFVKARPVAGDTELGREFLADLEPWVYRSYLSRADITGIKALRRRIEQQAFRQRENVTDVKIGRGGIRDIEFVIQFLQLLNGGDLPEIRTCNTLDAIACLDRAGCLTSQEATILNQNYVFLRRIEHRLQIMFDTQTHTLPEADDELAKLAIRMGYQDIGKRRALGRFKEEFAARTTLNRRILDHLLHNAFPDDEQFEPEVDLVLDPDPPPDVVSAVLARHGFRDIPAAYHNLMELADERIRFLSTRRCRHFLAAIAPNLLSSIAKTPHPDGTLVNLSRISDSLGGKGVLWELFSFSRPSMQLYVRLCAACPYLAGILTSNPGMIDELMDSLVLDRMPTIETLEETLADLCRGAEDIEPIVHSFKNSFHLRVGVRDILGKDNIRDTTATLSDVAEVCLRRMAREEYGKLTHKYGLPRRNGDGISQIVILGMGKLGGREPNYHSDLDVVFLFETDGVTRSARDCPAAESTSNQHFFSELGQRIVKAVTRIGRSGRLFALDVRLRPTGRSGPIAVSFDEFARYFREGAGQLWERQALCKARPIFGTPAAAARAMEAVRRAIVGRAWEAASAQQIRAMRYQMQDTASTRNLKRGPGGTVDIEFLVQMLQLKYAAQSPEILRPGTWEAIDALQTAGYLARDESESLTAAYMFLRSIEARLRLMNTTARHDLPSDPGELDKLAYLLHYENSRTLVEKCQQITAENRRLFDRHSLALSR